MIRCQMNCAGNNCSRPRSSEERVLWGGLVAEHVVYNMGTDAGFEGREHGFESLGMAQSANLLHRCSQVTTDKVRK